MWGWVVRPFASVRTESAHKNAKPDKLDIVDIQDEWDKLDISDEWGKLDVSDTVRHSGSRVDNGINCILQEACQRC